MKKLLVCLSIAACVSLFAADGANKSEPTFRSDYTNENFALPTYEWKAEAPGANAVLERSFENAPPLIPHNLDDMLPITTDNNMCLSCHILIFECCNPVFVIMELQRSLLRCSS